MTTRTSTVSSFLDSIWIKYWFFNWLFKDVSLSKNPFEYHAACHHNKENSCWLPLYAKRWSVLSMLCWGIGGSFENFLHWDYLAAAFFVLAVICVPVVVVALICWVFLQTWL